MHVLVIDGETDEVLIDADITKGKAVENKDATGTSTQTNVSGVVYHGVKVWVGPKLLANPYEAADVSVFVQWTDKSTTGKANPGKVHTVERPLPGGAVGRFVVTVS
jgi:hypothetical protein